MNEVITAIAIIVGISYVILFFKVLIMADDISAIRKKYLSEKKTPTQSK
ncbi:MAG: hypothetical protein AB2L20_30090 [Mangrovibacterium sp.]